ncbi:BLUF domain-containing protein [Sphingomonas sp. BK580]|uniref:BLUF domain-containing protein n=1 Tax=Sphingomonas sp. BK580 TaxID=2586972 RepID=UPI00160747D6|nr:BLUF domain-containing protein [Sphingomonas sp. BK580]MBB3693574.1 hypothetical protein [Sphingomonas sp. BK580]
MLLIVYMSRFASALTKGELEELGSAAAEKNLHLGVTGVLLYDNRRFMQAIEGPVSSVHGLMDTIARDTRHRELSYVCRDSLEQRQFDGWSMRSAHIDPSLKLAELRLQVADLLVGTTALPVKAAFFGFAATSRRMRPSAQTLSRW